MTGVLRLGRPVRFKDRWRGRLAAIEVDERWEALNAAIETRRLFRTATLRLPLQAATGSSDDYLAFDEITSRAAFRREIPPVGAPARPLSRETPISLEGTRLTGLIVERPGLLASAVIVRRGGWDFRVSTDTVRFEGKVMHLGVQPDALMPYYGPEELLQRVREAIARLRPLTPDEHRAIEAGLRDGQAVIKGNVRSRRIRDLVRKAAAAAAGPEAVSDQIIDDIELEHRIGLQLERAGLHRAASVYVRSTLGEVTVFGYAPSQAMIEEIERAVSRIPGVRSLQKRIAIAELPEPVQSEPALRSARAASDAPA
jgi:hypothetical protein